MAVLLATLRPFGADAIVGDQNDGTYHTFTGPLLSVNPFQFGYYALTDFDASLGTVEYVVVGARVAWERLDQGPTPATFFLFWRDLVSGDEDSAGPFSTTEGIALIATIASGHLVVDPSGGSWPDALLDALQLRVQVDGDDQGTQAETQVNVHELWAEVWGSPPAPVEIHEVESITLGCEGDFSESLACDGDIAITLLCDVDEEV